MADEIGILTEAQQLKLNGAKVRAVVPSAQKRDPMSIQVCCVHRHSEESTSIRKPLPCPEESKRERRGGGLSSNALSVGWRLGSFLACAAGRGMPARPSML